jgi:hypothetical protein
MIGWNTSPKKLFAGNDTYSCAHHLTISARHHQLLKTDVPPQLQGRKAREAHLEKMMIITFKMVMMMTNLTLRRRKARKERTGKAAKREERRAVKSP